MDKFDHGKAMKPYWNYNDSERNRSNVYRRDEGGRWQLHTFSQSELDEIVKIAHNFLLSRQSEGMITNNWHLCSEGFIFSNKFIPKPPVLRLDVDYKKGGSNGQRWADARTDKSIIVVSDYEIRKGSIVSKPYFWSDEHLGYYQYTYVTAETLVKYGFLKQHPDYRDRAELFGGACKFYVQTNIDIFLDGGYRQKPIDGILDQLNPLWEHKIDDGLVTEAIASADVACMDVLTTLAEMPETVRSVVNGFNSVSHIIRDAKRKEFSLTKAHEQFKKSKEKSFIASLSSLQRELALATSNKRRRAISRKIQRTQKAHLKLIRDSATELTSAIADVWLNFRYNIMPIVYTIDDINEVLRSLSATYKTSRTFDSSERSVELDDGVVKANVSQKCMIKRLLNPKVQFSSLTSANFISTAYQLVPYSFVADWFINAGDYITAMTSPSYALEEGATYSTKSIIKHNEDGLEIAIESYTRTVINPLNHRGLTLKFDMNFYRSLDAAALLWNVVKDKIIYSKRS